MPRRDLKKSISCEIKNARSRPESAEQVGVSQIEIRESPPQSSQLPEVANGLSSGANCQHFCYEILRLFGFEIDPLRSSELWEDLEYSQKVQNPQALDLVLFNSTSESFGAHVGICLG